MTREELEDGLNGLVPEAFAAEWGRPEWTRQTKKLLVRLGKEAEYKTCATREQVPEATWSEWLYDVVWLEATEDFQVNDIKLVAEIEWGNEGDVWDDFQKLPLARADVRVMIFEGQSQFTEALQRRAILFEKSETGDRYLLARYAGRAFFVEEFVV